MSALDRIADADGTVEEALAIKTNPADYEPGVARIEMLLRALVEAQVATAEAIVEATEHRRLAYRVEHPGVEYVPPKAASASRPYTGA